MTNRIDHTNCDHAKTPAARKICRAAVRALRGHTFNCAADAGVRAFENHMVDAPTGAEARDAGINLMEAAITECTCGHLDPID